MLFPSLSNVTIDLAGSTIWFNGPLLPNGLELYYCSNVTLKNFHIDYIHPPYTHVQLTSVDLANRVLNYQTLASWPDPASFNILTNPFGGGPLAFPDGFWAAIFRHGVIVPGTSRTLLNGSFSNNSLTIQDTFPWAQAATLSSLQPGDIIPDFGALFTHYTPSRDPGRRHEEIFFILVTLGILAVLAVLAAAYIMHFHPFLQQTWFFGIATCILFGYLVGIVSWLIERVLPLIERVLRVKE